MPDNKPQSIYITLLEILDRFGKQTLLDPNIVAIVKDIQPHIHPSYLIIIERLVALQLLIKLDTLNKQDTLNVIEVLNSRTKFKENNGFDIKAYEVFDAFCTCFNINIQDFAPANSLDYSYTKENFKDLNTYSYAYYRNPIIIDNKITSYDLKIESYSNLSVVEFLNKYSFKNTNTWRLPQSNELKSVVNQLRAYQYKQIWCTDTYSDTKSIFDVNKGTHEKSNGTKPIQQKLQFLAVSGVKYSTLLGKELALHLQYVDKWKMSIVTGFTDEFSWPEYFINRINKLKLYDQSNWRLPTITELSLIYNYRENLDLKITLPVWSSTQPKNFFVNVLDFKTGEIKEHKRDFDNRKCALIIVSEK